MCLTEKQVGAYIASAFQRDEWPVLTQRQRVLDAACRQYTWLINAVRENTYDLSWMNASDLAAIRSTFKHLWAAQCLWAQQ